MSLILKIHFCLLPTINRCKSWHIIGVKHQLLKRMLLTSAGSQGVHPTTVWFTRCIVSVSHDAVTADSCGGLSADIITLVGGTISEAQNNPIWPHVMVNEWMYKCTEFWLTEHKVQSNFHNNPKLYSICFLVFLIIDIPKILINAKAIQAGWYVLAFEPNNPPDVCSKR